MSGITVTCALMSGREIVLDAEHGWDFSDVKDELSRQLAVDSAQITLLRDTMEIDDADTVLDNQAVTVVISSFVAWEDVCGERKFEADEAPEDFVGWTFMCTYGGGPEGGYVCEHSDGSGVVFQVNRSWGTPWQFVPARGKQLLVKDATENSYKKVALIDPQDSDDKGSGSGANGVDVCLTGHGVPQYTIGLIPVVLCEPILRPKTPSTYGPASWY